MSPNKQFKTYPRPFYSQESVLIIKELYHEVIPNYYSSFRTTNSFILSSSFIGLQLSTPGSNSNISACISLFTIVTFMTSLVAVCLASVGERTALEIYMIIFSEETKSKGTLLDLERLNKKTLKTRKISFDVRMALEAFTICSIIFFSVNVLLIAWNREQELAVIIVGTVYIVLGVLACCVLLIGYLGYRTLTRIEKPDLKQPEQESNRTIEVEQQTVVTIQTNQ